MHECWLVVNSQGPLHPRARVQPLTAIWMRAPTWKVLRSSKGSRHVHSSHRTVPNAHTCCLENKRVQTIKGSTR